MSIFWSTSIIYKYVKKHKKSDINLIDYKPEVLIGYIYKITVSKSKKYIGSTNAYKKRWKQHEEAGVDMHKIYKMMHP